VQDEIGTAPRDDLAVEAVGLDEFRIARLDAVDVLHRQHAGGAILFIHAGDVHGRIAREAPAKAQQVAPFIGQIGFLRHGIGKLLDHLPRVDRLVPEQRDLEDSCQLLQDLRLGLDDLDDTGTTHFDDDVLPFAGRGSMDLGNTAGSKRRHLEAGKDILNLPVQFSFDLGLNSLRRIGLDLVLQMLQFADVLAGNEVGPRAQQLPELDEGRPHLLQG